MSVHKAWMFYRIQNIRVRALSNWRFFWTTYWEHGALRSQPNKTSLVCSHTCANTQSDWLQREEYSSVWAEYSRYTSTLIFSVCLGVRWHCIFEKHILMKNTDKNILLHPKRCTCVTQIQYNWHILICSLSHIPNMHAVIFFLSFSHVEYNNVKESMQLSSKL